MERQPSLDVASEKAARACGTCRFWQAHLPEFVRGECRMDAPMFRALSESAGPTMPTAVDDWCARWDLVRLVRPGAPPDDPEGCARRA